MRINSYDKTHFSGIPVARAKVYANGATDSYTLFELTHKDKPFLEELHKSIDLRELMPNLKPHEYNIWQIMLRCSLNNYIFENNRGLLLADQKNYPCGVLNYQMLLNSCEIKRITTWPVNPSERKLFAGKTMIMKIFQQVLEDKSKVRIFLDAIKESVFNPINRYLEMGFQFRGSYDCTYETMSIKRENIPNIIEKFQDNISLTPIENHPNINLSEVLIIKNKNSR